MSDAPRPWDALLSERDREVYRRAGYGQRARPGSRPALIVVDATLDFTGDRREPILDAIVRFPNACGERAWDAVPVIADLLRLTREAGLPVLYARPSRRGMSRKLSAAPPTTAEAEARGSEFPEQIAPRSGEVVLSKERPSAFFGTVLAAHLVALARDTVIVVGGTTSGCVRATVVDAFSHGLRVLVPEEATFDRGELSHAVSLFDMHQKYADVLSSSETVEYLHAHSRVRRTAG